MTSNRNHSGKVALVTGGNRGIGLETARQLAELGFTVLIGVRDLAKGEAAAKRLGGKVEAIALTSPRLKRLSALRPKSNAASAGSMFWSTMPPSTTTLRRARSIPTGR